MKTFVIISMLLISSISFGKVNPQLKNELQEKIILDLSEIELDNNKEDYVEVAFTVNNGVIEIISIYGTQLELVEKVKQKLTLLALEGEYDANTTYSFKFTFEKQ